MAKWRMFAGPAFHNNLLSITHPAFHIYDWDDSAHVFHLSLYFFLDFLFLAAAFWRICNIDLPHHPEMPVRCPDRQNVGDVLEAEILILLQMPAEPDQLVGCPHPSKLNHDGLLSGRSFPCAVSCILLHLTLFYCSFYLLSAWLIVPDRIRKKRHSKEFLFRNAFLLK